ncbi:sulfur carrier protein ThiS [Actinoallomurus vinaceus]|uniref:Sulfur carrier protein ThiS n=1 Tax=Actinoallomurus vinaceus TaxID=1080074 RepID=A0ABP8U7E1_9ACTN
MKITVNGAERDAPDGSSVAGVVASLTGRPAGVAVALNDEVVPRADWNTTILREADRIEVLTAVQGG